MQIVRLKLMTLLIGRLPAARTIGNFDLDLTESTIDFDLHPSFELRGIAHASESVLSVFTLLA